MLTLSSLDFGVSRAAVAGEVVRTINGRRLPRFNFPSESSWQPKLPAVQYRFGLAAYREIQPSGELHERALMFIRCTESVKRALVME